MPKPLNLNQAATQSSALRTAGPATRSASAVPLERALRARRSDRYLKALASLDTGSTTQSASAIAKVIDAIRAEFDELGISEYPLGLVQNCCLGDPYEVHVLSLDGAVMHHYKVGETMPPEFERARSLALHPLYRATGLIPTYAFIEVFATTLNGVRADGWTASTS